jgi:hypothetical protein
MIKDHSEVSASDDSKPDLFEDSAADKKKVEKKVPKGMPNLKGKSDAEIAEIMAAQLLKVSCVLVVSSNLLLSTFLTIPCLLVVGGRGREKTKRK